jgi:PPOX class probable F420-dependent enzyme
MPELSDIAEVGRENAFLAVVSTVRADGTVQSSLVNAGVIDDPTGGGGQVAAFATYGRAKLANLRARPALNLTFTAGWRWMAVEGDARIVGPDDPAPGVDADRLRLLLREVFVAAGGQHDDWDTYDRVMAEERRAVVLVSPSRVYSNRR